MSFLDRLRSGLRLGGADAAPRGPLGLAVGDRFRYYRDAYAVTGVRVLDGEGARVVHYVLRSDEGDRAVVVAEEGPETVLGFQRMVAGEVPWDQDVLTGLADEPFRVASRGRRSVRLFGDTGLRGARSVEYRVFQDPEGDRVVVLEDYQGQREVRVGETLHEAEIEREAPADDGAAVGRGGAGVRFAALPGYGAEEEPAGRSVRKGSPLAAAMALAEQAEDVPRDASPIVDHDPTERDEEEWADADDDAGAEAGESAGTARVRSESGPLSTEDESEAWLAAARYVAEHGTRWQDG